MGLKKQKKIAGCHRGPPAKKPLPGARSAGTRQRNFLKNKKIICRVPDQGHPAKKFKKIKKILCRVPSQGHPAKNF
jgi:hypothetical protein